MPLSGMTGFARVEGAEDGWSWGVEARSVNGRSLEVRFRGPSGFEGLEKTARETAQRLFARGQVGVTLTAKRAEARARVRVDEGAVAALLHAAEPFLAAGVVRKPTWDGLLAVRGVVETAEAEEPAGGREAVENAMAFTVGQALGALRDARRGEGAALAPVLGGLVDRIETLATAAEGHAAEQGPAMRERLRQRLAELLQGVAFSEERMLAEAAALAAKADVREELDRLAAHVGAARALLAAEDGAVGRKLDFLTQEFMREANTLCSKSASIPLTQVGLELKAAVDQLREQVQNVE